MIRGPLQPLFDRPIRTLLTLLMGGTLVALAVVVLLVTRAGDSAVDRWTAQFQPAILLAESPDSDVVEELSTTIRSWPDVRGLRRWSAEQNLEKTRAALDSKSFDKLELEPELFPSILVLEVSPGALTDVGFTARLQGLEARASVETVVLPPDDIRGWSRWFSWGIWLARGLVVLGLAMTWWQISAFLGAIHRAGARERRLLDRFGARPSRLRRPRWVRGLALGFGVGALSAAMAWTAVSGLRAALRPLAGGLVTFDGAGLQVAWLLVAGPVLGLLAVSGGQRTVDSEGESLSRHPGLDSVLTQE